MKREEILNTLKTAQSKAVNCWLLLGDYVKELESKDGKIYDSRVTKIEKHITNSNGEKWVYRANIYNAGFYTSQYSRIDFYFSQLDNNNHTIYGTNDCLQGEYLEGNKWIATKEGKTKQYFNAGNLIPLIENIRLRLYSNINDTSEIMNNLGDYIYHINALREEQRKIAEKLSVYTKPRAYFNNKNLGEMVR